MLPARVLVLITGIALLNGSLLVGAYQVRWLEQRELSHEGVRASLTQRATKAGATSISARLTEVALERGEQATFEVCAAGDLGATRFDGALDFVVWRPEHQKLELKVPLDAEYRVLVKRSGSRSCLTLGGGTIGDAGKYALDAVWTGRTLQPELANLPLWGRVLAKRPLSAREGLLVLCAALGAVMCALAGFTSGVEEKPAVSLPAQRSLLWALGFAMVGFLLFAGALRLPLAGALGGFARGMSIAVIEISLAVAGGFWVFGNSRRGLQLLAPRRRPGAWLLVACAAALALKPASRLAMQLIPSTGEAPIEAFISWPSGALTFAMLGMVVPLAEELFFRGLLFGTLSSLGKPVAVIGTILLFTAAHAQQAWGNWGALASVALTGVVLTLLRALSGSTLVPAITHVLFNLSLWGSSFGG